MAKRDPITMLKSSVKRTDVELIRMQALHASRIEAAVKKLEASILDEMQSLRLSKGKKLEGLRVNLKQAQKVHIRVEELFEEEFNRPAKGLVNDFSRISNLVERSYKDLDAAIEFTSVDREMMNVLRDGVYQDYVGIASAQKEKIIGGMYDMIIGGGKFSDLMGAVSGVLSGEKKGMLGGKSLASQSKMYAKDMLMQYQQEVLLAKSEDAGLDTFLYIGDVIATTRPFCRVRVGKAYTRNQIMAWNNLQWAGKSGPPMICRGGYNCRHHWTPIKREWMQGQKKIDVADWNLEQQKGG